MREENQRIEGWLGDAAKNEIFLNGELEARDIAIAKLENQLSGVVAELDRVRGELEAIKIGSNTGIKNQAELIKFIKDNYSDSSDINESVLAHAAETGEFLKLTQWGRKYGFRFLGKLVNDYGYEIVGDGGAIATLQTELDKIKGELEEKEQAIANLKAELAAGEVKQLPLFPPEPTQTPETVTASPVTEPEPTPSPSPETIPTPSTELNPSNPVIESSPVTETAGTGIGELATVGTSGLVDYINSVDPKSGITKDVIDNSLTRLRRGVKTGARSIPSLEAKYNFKYLGQNGRNHQFSIPKL